MTAPEGSPGGPALGLDPHSRVAIWPVILVIALLGISLLALAAAAPEESPRPPIPETPHELQEVPSAAAALMTAVLLMGMTGLLLALFRKRTRRKLLPPPFLGPRVSWGLAELVQGILLLIAFLLASGALAGLSGGGDAGKLAGDGVRPVVVSAAVLCGLVVALISLVAPHPGAALGALEPEDRSRAAMHELGLSASRPQSDVFKGLAFGIIALPVAWLVALIGVVLSRVIGLDTPVHPVVQRVQTEAGTLEIAALVLVAVVVVPLVEEVAFRGFIYPTLRQKMGLWWGVALSSLFFGLLHPGLPSVMATFVLGAALCGLYERTGSLLAPVVAHGTFNMIQLTLTMMMRFGGADA